MSELDKVREKMYKLLEQHNDDTSNKEILQVSQQLDILIVADMKANLA
jgi:hypothetical protein